MHVHICVRSVLCMYIYMYMYMYIPQGWTVYMCTLCLPGGALINVLFFAIFSCLGVKYAHVSHTHINEGRGFLLFRLVNMRAPLIMGFLRGGESPW